MVLRVDEHFKKIDFNVQDLKIFFFLKEAHISVFSKYKSRKIELTHEKFRSNIGGATSLEG